MPSDLNLETLTELEEDSERSLFTARSAPPPEPSVAIEAERLKELVAALRGLVRLLPIYRSALMVETHSGNCMCQYCVLRRDFPGLFPERAPEEAHDA